MIEEMDDDEKQAYIEEQERVEKEFEELELGEDEEFFSSNDEYMGF